MATSNSNSNGNGNSNEPSLEDASPGAVQKAFMAMSSLITRAQLAARAGLRFDTKRDLYDIFGYKKTLNTEDFLIKYIRQDIASRIIDAPPGATWSNPPSLEGFAGADDWEQLVKQANIWNAMYRADRLARLYPYSVLVFGFDDTTNMKRPLNPEGVTELLYVRPIGSRMIDEITLITDPRNPRYGKPDMYKITFDEPKSKIVRKGDITKESLRTLEVHHSRVVHIVENALEDDVVGIPIMERVFNLLDDLLKVSGGTSETYWLAGNKGMQADVDPELDLQPDDAAALSDEIEEYQHQLRRFIRTRGVTLKDLGGDTPNPEQTFGMILSLIAGATGIPKRILLGSEAGELASAQDRANWAERIDERRALFAEPHILRPSVMMLQQARLVGEGEFDVKWPSAFRVSPLERAQTMAQTARAIGNMSRQTGNNTPMQITSRMEARNIIGLEGDLSEADLAEFANPEMEDPQSADPGTQDDPSRGIDDEQQPPPERREDENPT